MVDAHIVRQPAIGLALSIGGEQRMAVVREPEKSIAKTIGTVGLGKSVIEE